MGYVGTKPTAAPLTTSQLEDGLVTAAKLATDAVETAKVKDLNVTVAKLPAAVDISTKTVTLPATVGGLGTGIDAATQLANKVPAANLGTGTASVSTFLAGNQTYQTITEYDDSVLQSNIAMLGFKVAVNGSLTRYNLVDQSIDEFFDTSGVDAPASTNENRVASGSNYYYSGTVEGTATQDADDTGVDGLYTWYKWTDTAATGSYSYSSAQTHEFLVVAGGGGGGSVRGGGGGAGGLRASYGSVSGGGASAQADLDMGAAVTYTMTVGAGGTKGVWSGPGGGGGGNGGASSITGSDIPDVTTVGGGGGLGNNEGAISGRTGGSGGGMTDNQNQPVGAGTADEGFAGAAFSTLNSGAGGGASAAGGIGGTVAGIGGAGLTITITGASVGYAGGGGGGANDANYGTATDGGGAGGTGGVAGTDGTDGTGGGGGGAGDTPPTTDGGVGGSGVVILRRLTAAGTTYTDMTLQSTDVTALAEPDFGEFVTLIENAAGTATLNTDIKGYVSRDSGVTFTQGTLVDEGTWGTNKKILGFHDLDISSQPSGTSMCYKITTHNQAVGLQTGVYATSIGWR